MRIAMIGATGLVGRQLWPLLEARHDLLVLGRRPSGAKQEKLGSMQDWPTLLADERVDIAVSTLGTTRKAAGSWAAFEAVDHHAVLAFAAAARNAGARHFLGVSSTGADAASRTAYLRLKGEVEQVQSGIGFERVDLVRPGLLLGERPGETRIAERIATLVDPLSRRILRGSWDRYAGIDAGQVAKAMAVLAERNERGIHRHHNREIRALAD